MQKILLVTAILLISACSAFFAERLSDDTKELYDYGNNQEYCRQYPNRCIGNLPKY